MDPTCVCTRHREVQTSDHVVCGVSRTTLATDSRSCALHCKATPAHVPARAHDAQLGRKTRNKETSIRVRKPGGAEEKERWERRAPFRGLPNVASTAFHCVLVQQGTKLRVASHGATRQVPGRPHRGTVAWHLPPKKGGFETLHSDQGVRCPGGRPRRWGTCVQGGHLWVTRPDHGQRVGPTGPNGANCILETQSTHGQGE